MLSFLNPNTCASHRVPNARGFQAGISVAPQPQRTLWLTLVKGVLSVMVSKGDRAPFPSVGAATSQLNCMEDWLIPASPQRSFMRAYLGKWGSQGVTQMRG